MLVCRLIIFCVIMAVFAIMFSTAVIDAHREEFMLRSLYIK